MNVNKVLTKDYDKMDTWSIRKNKPNSNPIQSQSNPIQTQLKPKQTQYKPKQTQLQRQNYTGCDNRCYKSTAAFTKINLNRNCFLVKPLYQVRKNRQIQRVDFLKHGLLIHIRIAFRIVETKVKVYTLCWPLSLLFDVRDKAKHKAFFRTFRYEFCTNTILNSNL
jgi:hypothetical protein